MFCDSYSWWQSVSTTLSPTAPRHTAAYHAPSRAWSISGLSHISGTALVGTRDRARTDHITFASRPTRGLCGGW